MITQPENLTKDRLKAELKKHRVTFSPTRQKSYYVELYRERVMGRQLRSSPRKRSEFSSDEEIFAKTRAAQVTPLRKRYSKVSSPETYQTEVSKMSDSEMAKRLKQYGVDVGPIMASTRALYERKLAKLMSENVKSAQSKSISIVASESDDEEFSSESDAEGEEELDVGGVEDYYPPPTRKRTDRTTPVKIVVMQGSHSYKPTPRSGIQQSQQQQQQQRLRPRPEAHRQQPTKPGKPYQQTGKKQRPKEVGAHGTKWLCCWLWWLLRSLLVISISFLVAFVVFDYIVHGQSRLVNCVCRWSCPWIESLCYDDE